MNVVIFGASGMVGQGVLLECLRDTSVEQVLVIGRSPVEQQHAKLREVWSRISSMCLLRERADRAGCMLFLPRHLVCRDERGCISSPYLRSDSVIAQELAARNSALCFVYVSGASTDSTERGRTMWARVKGAAENALLKHALSQRLHVPAGHYPAAGRHPLENTRVSTRVCGDGAGHASAAPRVSEFRPDNARDWPGDARRGAQGLAATGARGEGHSCRGNTQAVTRDAAPLALCRCFPLVWRRMRGFRIRRAEDTRKHGRDGRRSTLQLHPA